MRAFAFIITGVFFCACQDVVQYLKNDDEAKGHSVFVRYSGRICQLTSEDGRNALQANCEEVRRFLDADSEECNRGQGVRFAYFPDQSQPMHLCRSKSEDLSAKEKIRFLVTGDIGAGESAARGAHQIMVARAMADLCGVGSAGGSTCDFVLVSGDLIYPSGAESVFDSILTERFENPYETLGELPFYLVAGNHDYLGSVMALIEYSYFSDRWSMPGPYYSVPKLPGWLHIQGIDTNAFLGEPQLRDLTGNQLADIKRSFCQQTGWKFLFGHHPTLSSGNHGPTAELLPIFADLHRDCDFDVYFSGHDHHQEHIQSALYHHIVQGAGGAQLRDVSSSTSPTDSGEFSHGKYWQHFVRSAHGFAIVEATADQVDIYFFDLSLYEYDGKSGSFAKPPTEDSFVYHCQMTAASRDCVKQTP